MVCAGTKRAAICFAIANKQEAEQARSEMLKVRNPLRNKFTGGQTNGTLSFNARSQLQSKQRRSPVTHATGRHTFVYMRICAQKQRPNRANKRRIQDAFPFQRTLSTPAFGFVVPGFAHCVSAKGLKIYYLIIHTRAESVATSFTDVTIPKPHAPSSSKTRRERARD